MNAQAAALLADMTQRRPNHDPVEDRLQEWADWVLAGDPLVRAGASAGFGSGTARPQEQAGYIPPRVEQCEKAIGRLRLWSKLHKRVLFRHWLSRMGREECARGLWLTVTRFESMLDEAHDFVGRELESLERVAKTEHALQVIRTAARLDDD